MPIAVTNRANKPIVRQHLEALWNVLRRAPSDGGGTLVPLPFPYIVPGGRFREIYYWDSYFTMLGLQVSGQVEMIQNMVDNFAYLISEIGFIPNGNRTYYLGRSQPPFFALMINLLGESTGESSLLKYREPLEKEYAFWMDGEDRITEPGKGYRRVVKLPGEVIVNRYWDDNDTPRPEAYTEDIQYCREIVPTCRDNVQAYTRSSRIRMGFQQPLVRRQAKYGNDPHYRLNPGRPELPVIVYGRNPSKNIHIRLKKKKQAQLFLSEKIRQLEAQHTIALLE